MLGKDVDEETIWKELETYLNLYRVSLETAKRSIVKKFGGDPSSIAKGTRKQIGQLGVSEQSVDLLVKVITANQRDIEVDGTSKPILYGILGDESGTVPFTAWDADRYAFGKGDVVLIRNAYTKEWGGQPQVNLGNRAIVEPQDPGAVSLGEGQVPYYQEPKEVKTAGLQDNMGNVTVTGRILTLEKKSVETSAGAKTVFSGTIADDLGKVQFSAWHDFGLKQSEVITIRGAYVRGWRGIPQLNFGERAQVTRSQVKFPSAADLSKPTARSIGDLERAGGGIEILVAGTIVDVRKGTGLIFRCPECNRVVQKGSCRIHGTVSASPDLRIKAVVDDGSSAMTAIMGRKITESLTGIGLEDALRKAREAMNPDVIRERIEEKLFAQPVELVGNVTSDEYGLMMIVSAAKIVVPEVREQAAALLAMTEGSA
ncbi:MAG: DNA-binding protein [Euryarchaeota archaeon]|nr:DNA-binding protein [Euryarchaeota archaeon]